MSIAAKLHTKFCSIMLILITFSLIFQSQVVSGAIYTTPKGVCTLEITKMDYSSNEMHVHITFEESTSTIFGERATSTIVATIEGIVLGSPSKYNYSVIIDQNDPEWKLIGTNIENVSYWKLEKDFVFSFNKNSMFPFEELKTTFYFASTKQHYFTASSPSANYYTNANLTDIDVNQFPTNILVGSFFSDMSSQNFRQISQIELTTGCNNVVKFAASMIYVILGIFIILLLIIKRGTTFKTSETINIFISVLVFLPILLFTFRAFIAPNYITLIDIFCFLLIIIYGVCLCFKFHKKTQKRNVQVRPDYEI